MLSRMIYAVAAIALAALITPAPSAAAPAPCPALLDYQFSKLLQQLLSTLTR